jgi:uncharacterized protein (TIGR02271 family)
MADINEQTWNTVAAYFTSEEAAVAAVHALRSAGFNAGQIGIVGRPEKDAFNPEDTRLTDSIGQSRSYGTEQKSGFWERIKEMFEGEPSEAYSSHAVEPNSESRLAGSRDAGQDSSYDYDSGDFHQSLSGLPEERSRYFSSRFGETNRGVLVTVRAGDRRSEAEMILRDQGGDIGSEMAEYQPAGTLNAAPGTAAYGNQSAELGQPMETPDEDAVERTGDVPATQRMKLYGEVLRVHRDRIQRGEVRLRKEVITETQTVNVPVTREELVMERVSVAGEQAAPGAQIGESAELRIPLSEDRVSVEKEPVLREEVRVGKRDVTSVESHDETVRREELQVDNESQQRKAS